MTTIVDVAARAGVSATTVSHVLNGTRKVAEETRRRVVEAVEVTGYRQDVLARSLRTSRTDSIGLVVSDAGQPTFAEMIRGVEAQAAASGYVLLLANSNEKPGKERRSVETLAARRVDGLIVATVAHSAESVLEQVRTSGTPVVYMDRVDLSRAGDQVGVENAKPMAALVRHLRDHGCTRIGIAAGDRAVATMAERYDAFEATVAACRLPLDEDLVLVGSGLASDTEKAAYDLLASSRRPEAMICASTETAVGVMRAASTLGLEIPKDLKLATFDGFPHADLFQPGITTVAQPAFDIGAAAMEMLGRRLDERRAREEGEPSNDSMWNVARLSARVTYRASCGCSRQYIEDIE